MASHKVDLKLGFDLQCPHCHETGGIHLDLNDLHADLQCTECSDAIKISAAIALFSERLAAWEKLRRFLDEAAKLIEQDDETAF